jgi:uncharacterized coiled-coil protein SlyX
MLNMMGEITGRFGEINSRLNTMDEMNGRLGELNDKFGEMSQTVNSHSQSISKLEAQVRQIANTLNRREEGKLPSQPVINPKGLYMVNETSHLEQIQAITTLQSGRVVDNHVEEKKEEQLETPQTKHQDKGKLVINDTSSYDPISETPYVLKAPYLKRLKASSHFGKQEEKIQDMMEAFKQIKVNIPLLDAIKQVPAYAKFLKDLCTQKRKNWFLRKLFSLSK